MEPFIAYQGVSLSLQSAPSRVHIVHCVLLRIILLGVREGVRGWLLRRGFGMSSPARPRARPPNIRLQPDLPS